MKKYLQIIFLLLFLVGGHEISAKNKKETFAIGKKTFLLNGKPFVIKAAELHYTRIPHEYWEHRIKMCKALGMNTICLYVFWNIHEQTPDNFDFEGQNDVAQFCRLAQENDMYVIVRPGPYVCAEWEMGGLPWWLLKKKDIKLRTNDPYYMERVGIFMNEVGKQLADLQITRGGNIIMVQVENEYGSYATDKTHVSAIRNMVKEAGFDEIPLFQCDWSSNFLNNALDDLVWTINFGTGANIDKQFEKLQEVRPESPLMCSEFWSGWFDHWGRPHETRKKEALINGMKDMLDKNISFSLYMTHGGTTFGHWGGANSPPYSTMCSSYDYDAPINEAGQVTEKYFAVRKLLENYLGRGEKLDSIPEPLPMIEIHPFNLDKQALLFDNLPQPIRTIEIKTMEEVDQGWGTILYRHILTDSYLPSILAVTEVHDWAQVFINEKRLGVLDRRKGEKSLALPFLEKGDTLDILVEAMGRVNFGKTIHDYKGITEKVELLMLDEKKELLNWEIYRFPVDYDFTSNKKYKAIDKKDTPSYYKGTFKLLETGDVFLDMRRWGKGMVWVNGYSLGRFWKIGPQQTLFLPGCWLKEGENEIIILDLDGPQQTTVSGIKEPILDMLRPDETLLHRKEGEELNLAGETAFFTGSFKPGNGWQEVLFPSAKAVRYFCMETLNTHGGDDFAAIAELDIIGENGKPISRNEWSIAYADSEEISAANNSGDKIYDLQESTFWHTEYRYNKPSHPHYIVVDMGKTQLVKGFRYLPRAEANHPGMIKDYRIYLINEGDLKIDNKD